MTTAIAVLLTLSAAAQDGNAERIKTRIDREFAEALTRTRARLRKLVQDEVAAAVRERDLADRIDTLAGKLRDDLLHRRLKALLLSKNGKEFAVRFITGQHFTSFDEVVDLYFEKDDKGRWRIREEFEETLGQLLDELAPPDPGPAAALSVDLGIRYVELAPGDRLGSGIPETQGIRIVDVVEGSVAAKAGLRKEDLLLSLGGNVIRPANVDEVVKRIPLKTEVDVEYYRGRSKAKAKLTLEERRSK